MKSLGGKPIQLTISTRGGRQHSSGILIKAFQRKRIEMGSMVYLMIKELHTTFWHSITLTNQNTNGKISKRFFENQGKGFYCGIGHQLGVIVNYHTIAEF